MENTPQKKCENCNCNKDICPCLIEQQLNRAIAVNKQLMLIRFNANYVRTRMNPKEWLLDTSLQLN